MLSVSQPPRSTRAKTEDALDTALRAVARNLVSYAAGNFTASTDKDRRIQRVTDALARSQEELAAQVASYMSGLHREPNPGYFPAEYTSLNFVSYSSVLRRMLEDLSARHAKLAAARNELLEEIRKATDTAALLTASKVMIEKAVEKLNAEAPGITTPVKLAADPPELKGIVPTVKVIEVVEHVGVAGGGAAVTTTTATESHGHDAHGGAHDDHGGHGGGHGGAHDDHGGHGDAHAPAAAVAEPTPPGSNREHASLAATPAEAAPEPRANAAPEPVAEAPKAAVDEDAGFVPTWKVETVARLDPAKTNFLLASETADAGQLERLAHDALHLVRHNVVMNPSTPRALLEGLKGDPNPHVRRAAREKLKG